MYKLKYFLFTFLFLLSFASLFQSKEEGVYIMFNLETDEKCKVDVEGKGMTEFSKFRIEELGGYIDFKICSEQFRFDKKTIIDTLPVSLAKKLKLVDLTYLNNEKNKSPMRVNPFKKIFILKKNSDKIILKYPVIWIDGMVIQNE